MCSKRVMATVISIVFLAFICLPTLSAQMKSVIKFKGVTTPLKISKQDVTIKKGKYDFEMVRHQARFCLRVYKGRKLLGTFEGDESPYLTSSFSDMPTKPTLKMNKFSNTKELVITIETGTQTALYPGCRMKFRFEYE